MKCYKLIREYPGSPKLGTIVKVESDGYIHWNVNSNNNNPTNYIHSSSMKQYEEFWEEIIEKDYEILSLKNNDYQDTFVTDFSKFTSERALFYEKYLSIYSVKRLSDGEIFTVGDLVNNKKLEKITLAINEKNDIVLHLENLHRAVYLLKDKPLKTKQPLFTTEDGVNIFDEKQLVYSVSECDYELQNHQDYAWVKTRNIKRKYHHFSTKEKAEEYILMNKPCLSLKEVLEIVLFLDRSEKKLKELVQQKLNNENKR